MKEIHVWSGGIQQTGGIQAYTRDFLEVLHAHSPSLHVEAFLKNDRDLKRAGAFEDLRSWGFGGFPEGVRSLAFAMGVLARALTRRPSLVVSGHVNFAPLARTVKRLGVPYWMLCYGVEVWNALDESRRRALNEASLAIAISQYTAERLIEGGVDGSRVRVLPCSFDASRFRPAGKPAHLLVRHGLRADQPVILTVARLASTERYKGYDAVIEGMPRIEEEVPGVRYVLVGEGEDRGRLERKIHHLGLKDAVTMAGRVPDDELVDYYNLCDVFAMPSRGEGFGIVFLEALGCGKPVVAGAHGGARDPLMDGELGVLVDPDDSRALTESIVMILKGEHPNPLLYRPDELRRRVVAEFGPERFRERLGRIVAKEMGA